MDKNKLIEEQIKILQEKTKAAVTAEEALQYNEAITNLLLLMEGKKDAPASVKI